MNDTLIKVLLIEDNPGDARLIREMLAEARTTRFDVHCHDQLSIGLEHLSMTDTDVVLLDLTLPDSQGLDTLTKVQSGSVQVPVVVLTGLDDETVAIKAVQEGAQDYLVKGQLDSNLLTHSICYAIERYRLMVELEQTRQQQLRVKDRFLSQVSHELRTPLAAIHQFVTILLDGLAGSLASEQREYLDIALRNTNQLRTMVADLLEVTRAQTDRLNVNPQCVSLTELIKETLETVQVTSGTVVFLSDDVSGDLPPVYADPGRVRQILVNLVNNAIQFTTENGTITVRAQVHSENPDYLCVSVADTGCGINPEEQEQIFDYLYQGENNAEASRRGLGLGLNICKELVTRQGGRIWVDSEIGCGSTFSFTLPVFSLRRLLAPILRERDLQAGSMALITVEISPVGKRLLTKCDETAVQGVWNSIHRSLPADTALLLPLMPDSASGKVFFVLAITGQCSTEPLFLQIQQQLVHSEGLADADLDPVISYTMLDIPSREGIAPPDQLAEDAITCLENLIESRLDQKVRSR